MTLLINYMPVLHQPTGIGVYANAVLPALQKFPHILVPGGETGTTKERLKRLIWTQLELPKIARIKQAELVFTPAPEGFIGHHGISQIVMVHDLRPYIHPCLSFQSLYFRLWVPTLLHNCAHILTNSYFTAKEIQRLTHISDDRITVTPLGYDSKNFFPKTSEKFMSNRPYFLHVGQQYPHKNISRLVSAFSCFRSSHPDFRLVLAGKPHPRQTPRLRAMIAELSLDEHVEILPYVPYEQLANLYRRAHAFVYPSLWEGFGLPILEAMACGTPVITSFGSGMEEVAGNAAYLINPSSTSSISDALTQVGNSSQLRDSLILRGLIRAESFSWESTANATAQVVSQHLD